MPPSQRSQTGSRRRWWPCIWENGRTIYLRRWAGRKYKRLRTHKRFSRWWAGLLQRAARPFRPLEHRPLLRLIRRAR